MRQGKYFKRVLFVLLLLLTVAVVSRLAVGLPVAGAPSQKFLEWGTEVFDSMFELVMAQTEEFQSESQLLVGAALVSGMVKALETAGTESSPVWVGFRRVFAILVASGLVIGLLLTTGGTLVLLLGIAVSEDVLLGSVVLKTLVALGVTIPMWFIARSLLAVITPKGLRLPQVGFRNIDTSTELDSGVVEPSTEP